MTVKDLYYYCENGGRNKSVDKYVNAIKNVDIIHNHQYLLGLLIEAKVSIDNVKKIMSGQYDQIYTQKNLIVKVIRDYLWLKRPTHQYACFTSNDWCEEILKKIEA